MNSFRIATLAEEVGWVKNLLEIKVTWWKEEQEFKSIWVIIYMHKHPGSRAAVWNCRLLPAIPFMTILLFSSYSHTSCWDWVQKMASVNTFHFVVSVPANIIQVTPVVHLLQLQMTSTWW